jgi:hypothetical protein
MKRKSRPQPNKREKAHVARVATLACVVGNTHCRGRTTVHHKSGAGMGMRADPFETMPLCEGHHLFGPYSIEQMGSKAWERHHLTQVEYLQVTRLVLAKLHPDWDVFTGEAYTGCMEDQVERILQDRDVS